METIQQPANTKKLILVGNSSFKRKYYSQNRGVFSLLNVQLYVNVDLEHSKLFLHVFLY